MAHWRYAWDNCEKLSEPKDGIIAREGSAIAADRGVAEERPLRRHWTNIGNNSSGKDKDRYDGLVQTRTWMLSAASATSLTATDETFYRITFYGMSTPSRKKHKLNFDIWKCVQTARSRESGKIVRICMVDGYNKEFSEKNSTGTLKSHLQIHGLFLQDPHVQQRLTKSGNLSRLKHQDQWKKFNNNSRSFSVIALYS